MFARRTCIGLAFLTVLAAISLTPGVLRDGASPARGGADALTSTGCRVTAPAMAMHGSSGLIMLATNVKMDPKTGRILSCQPVRGLGPLTYDRRYGRPTT